MERGKALEIWLLIFFLFSALGWVWEALLTYRATGQWVDRGMLYGPWLPVYGVGGVLLAMGLSGRRGVKVLIWGAVIGGVVEYGTAWVLEVLYHQRWWDYSGYAGSIQGRVCFASLAGFGLAGWLIARAAPHIARGISGWPDRVRMLVCRSISVLCAIDWAISLLRPNMGEGITCSL